MTEIILFLFVIVCHQFGSGTAEGTCGVPNSGDILDGCHDAEPHQFPWHVQMTMCGYTCGGTVISIFSNFLFPIMKHVKNCIFLNSGSPYYELRIMSCKL